MPDFDPTERELQSLLGGPESAQHPSLQLLLASGQQVLPPEIEARVQAHLQGCTVCTLLLKDVSSLPDAPFSTAQQQRIAATLPPVGPGTVPVVSSRRRLLPLFAALAALLLVFTGIFVFAYKRPIQLGQTSAPQPVTPQPVPPAVIAQLEIPFSPLAPPADDALALQTRGAAAAEPSIEALLPAFTAYNKGDFQAASKRFVPLLATSPHSEIVPLYLGVARLQLGEDQQAFEALTTAQKNATPDDLPTAQWYAAIAAQRLKRPEAHALLTSLCNTTGSKYSAQSCRIAATLP